MKNLLQLNMESVADSCEIDVTGDLNESCGVTLEKFELPKAFPPLIRFNLKGIGHVNSLGIRDWARFLKKFVGRSRIAFSNWSPTFVMAANVIPDMTQGGKIESVARGYECRNNHHFWRITQIGELDQATADQKLPCEKFGLKASPEYDADEYFAFLEAG